MIDDSEKRKRQLASALQNSSVFEKCSNQNADSNLGLLSSWCCLTECHLLTSLNKRLQFQSSDRKSGKTALAPSLVLCAVSRDGKSKRRLSADSSDRRYKRKWNTRDQIAFYARHLFLVATWRLGLRAPLVTGKTRFSRYSSFVLSC